MSAEAVTLPLHAALARALADHGVDTLFGLMGDANLFMVDSFVRNEGGRFIAAAHEGGAALMALGHAAITGRPGVATVTHGPAVANTLTALAEGVKGALPMLLICGNTAAEDRDNLQNLPQQAMIAATGAGVVPLRAPRTMADDLAEALRRTALERRPVALDVPADFQRQEVAYSAIQPRRPEAPAPTPQGEDLDDAAGILAGARRPLLLAGRGAAHAAGRAAILRLARQTGAPVATTLKAKDLFRGTPGDLGIFGTLSTPRTLEVIGQSDCIVSFGASLTPFTTARGALLTGKRVVQINADPADIGRYAEPTVGLVADPVLAAERLATLLHEAGIPDTGHVAALPAHPPEPAPPLWLRQALDMLDAAVPEDRILVTDGGRFVLTAWQAVRAGGPCGFVHTLNSGAIGLGLAQAIGAGAAAPGRPVLLVTGDGGFMLGGLGEFNTAVRHGIDLIVLVCNDGGYGAEHEQFRARNLDPGLALLDWPDLAPVAEALGGRGITLRCPADLGAMTAAIRDRDRPLLIDLKLDPYEVPGLVF